jgi:hypothetical protein
MLQKGSLVERGAALALPVRQKSAPVKTHGPENEPQRETDHAEKEKNDLKNGHENDLKGEEKSSHSLREI